MQKSVLFLLSLLMVLNFGCSSVGKDGDKREFKKDYVVVDAQYERYPGWVNEPQAWADKKDSKDFKKYRYFVSTSEITKNKRLCMKSAEAQTSAKIAGEITQFIKNTYGQSVQGDADDEVEQYLEDTLAQEIQSFLVGARQHRTYWEKRNYKTELGAEDDKSGYVCSALLKMERKTIKKAISRAMKKLFSSTANPESKGKVKKALKDVESKFDRS